MKWRILSTQESEEWHELLGRFPKTDVYFLAEYHRAYELNGDGTAYAFIAEEGDHILFYPFLVRPIERVGSEPVSESWYDVETVYGYSGPLCTTTDMAFLARAWAAFAAWCHEKRIVAEFIRFNPTMENYRYVDHSCKVVLDRETIIVKLDCSEEELWESYPSVQRNMVRKALKKGLICEQVSILEGLHAFRYLYGKTMDRVRAHYYYYFSDAYFSYLSNALAENVRLFMVRDKDQVVAAALFLLYGDGIHYHLAGSDVRYKEAAPNNLLIHTVALWGLQHGFRWLHLGGGRTSSPDDALFRFKASISRLRLPFYIGKRVHDRDAYERLCAEWMQQKGVTTRPSYFLLYRLEENN
jgi:hypothetical protein